MTATRAALLTRLARVQNHDRNCHQDIMTITAFMDETEVLRHVELYERTAEEADAKRPALAR